MLLLLILNFLGYTLKHITLECPLLGEDSELGLRERVVGRLQKTRVFLNDVTAKCILISNNNNISEKFLRLPFSYYLNQSIALSLKFPVPTRRHFKLFQPCIIFYSLYPYT